MKPLIKVLRFSLDLKLKPIYFKRTKNINGRSITALFALLLTTSCLNEKSLVGEFSTQDPASENPSQTPENPLDGITYAGCTSGTALSTTSGRVEYDFPTQAEKVNIYIDGTLAYSSSNSYFTSYTDRNLSPGTTYTFACEIQTGDYRVMGSQTQDITTPADSSTPATFPGISAVVKLSSSSVRVEWTKPAGYSATTIKVFATPGSNVDFADTPVKQVSYSLGNTTITNLGDELPYSFGVRACNSSNVCEENTVQITDTLVDGGAPRTQGAISASYIGASTSALVHAPWEPSDGAISKRRVYISGPSHGNGLGGTNIGNYVQWGNPAFNVTDIANPPTQLTVSGISSDMHYFIVRDEDPSGNLSTAQTFTVVNYRGCISATALSTSAIRVAFDYPTGADFVRVYQNGVLISSSSSPSISTVTSSGLTEGQSYVYECEMQLNGQLIRGSNVITQATLSINPPTFAGIKTATALSPTSVRVTWDGVGSGVLADYFQVYGNPGTSVDWNASPIDGAVDDLTRSLDITGLGDGLPYVFGVRACSATNICDTNTATRTITLNDSTFAPNTSGITTASFSGGGILTVTAPWTYSNGKVSERRLYMATSALGPYSLLQTYTVTDALNVPTSMQVTDTSNFTDNTTYYFYINDVDGAANVKDNSATYVSAGSGDLVAPTFPETHFISVTKGSSPDTSINLTLKAVNKQPDDANGVSHYVVYLKEIPTGTNNTACTAGTRHTEISVSDGTAFPTYTSGNNYTVSITGLNPRTRYGICLKARDQAGNISTTAKALWHKTFDVTAPSFIGIAATNASNSAFVNENEEVEITWATSTSSDTKTYQVKLWRGSKTVPVDLYTSGLITHPTSTLKISRTTFNYTDFEELYVLVNACDNALEEGFHDTASNCTSYTYSNARSLIVPDITPPQGFDGIVSAEPNLNGDPPSVTIGVGEALVKWNLPSTGNWNDYAGLKVYTVGAANALTEVGTVGCNIATVTCPTQYKVTGLALDYKTYKFHIRAYDSTGALTTYVNPTTSFAQARTIDTTPPTFNSNLQASLTTQPTLTWSAATDNQSDASARIFYDIYRKDGSIFANLNAPENDANASFLNRQTLSYTDNSTLSEGVDYYYLICARDETGNKSCDSASIVIFSKPDSVAPVFAGAGLYKNTSSSILRETADRIWSLRWSATDNTTPLNQLRTSVYVKYGTSMSDVVTYDTQSGTPGNYTDQLADEESSLSVIQQLSGRKTAGSGGQFQGELAYISYLIVVKDNIGNASYEIVGPVEVDNRLTATSMTAASGSSAGGTTVLIRGEGFANDTEVRIGGNLCTSPDILNSKLFKCATPAGTGIAVVQIINTDGVRQNVPGGYSYGGSNACDLAANPGSSPFHAGNGTEVSPYLICNATQFQTIGQNNATYKTFYFALGAHLDLSGVALSPIGDATNRFTGGFDGQNFSIANASIVFSSSANIHLGIFGNILNTTANSTSIKNLVVIDSSVEYTGATTTTYAGILVGYSDGQAIQNVQVIGGSAKYSVVGNYICHLGGVVGYLAKGSIGGSAAYAVSASDVYIYNVSTNASSSSGGIAGYTQFVATSLTHLSSSGEIEAIGGTIGGLIGSMNSSLTNAYSTANIRYSGSAVTSAGGLIGEKTYSSGITTVSHVWASGSVEGRGQVGGLIGFANGGTWTIQNAWASGPVKVNAGVAATYYYGGGLVGAVSVSGGATIQNSYATGNVTGGINTYTGGLVGGSTNVLNITNSWASGNLTDSVTASGGLIGGHYSTVAYLLTVSNSSARGNVTGVEKAGGFIGHIGASQTQTPAMSITNSYARGNVTTTGSTANAKAAGFIATVTGGPSSTWTFTGNYSSGTVSATGTGTRFGFLNETFANLTTGINAANPVNFWQTYTGAPSSGAPAGITSGLSSKTVSLMKNEGTYTGAGWNVDETSGIWKMDPVSGYPVHRLAPNFLWDSTTWQNVQQ